MKLVLGTGTCLVVLMALAWPYAEGQVRGLFAITVIAVVLGIVGLAGLQKAKKGGKAR